MPDRRWPCKWDKLLHELVRGIATEANKRAGHSLANSPGAFWLPYIYELPSPEVAEYSGVGKGRISSVRLADNHLFQCIQHS